MVFGVVRQTEEDLKSKFGVEKFPTLLIITNPFEHKGDKYEKEEFGIKPIQDFMRPYAYGDKKQ